MELKVVDIKPFSNERIDAFYLNLEQQAKNAERVEELEYNESKTIITRRNFLQYSALGAIGLGLSLGTQRAEAGGPQPWEKGYRGTNFMIRPKKIIIDQYSLRAGEPAKGRIIVSNETDKTEYNQMILKPISYRSLKETKESYCEYKAPSFAEIIYEFFNGPWAIGYRKRTPINILASNEYAKKRSRRLFLYA